MKSMFLAANATQRLAFCAAIGLFLSLGCSHDSKPAVTATPTAPPPQAATSSTSSQASIEVSESLRKRCDLPNEPAEAPQFDFDQAALRPRGEGILEGLARCMLDGNMKGQSIAVVGHADPRGSDSYNFALGERRAQAAADYLKGHGVPSEQVWIKSRGEKDATGSSEQEWQLDRNVQIAEKTE